MADQEPPVRWNVVQIFSSLEPGGAEVRTLELFEVLHEAGTHFRQVVFQTGNPGSLTPAFLACGTRVITERFRSAAFWWLLFNELRRPATAALHVHVKRGNAISALFLPLAKVCGVPVRIVHFRSDGTYSAGGRARAAREWCYLRLVNRFATNIIGVSPASLSVGWHPDWKTDPRCQVVLSGVRLDRMVSVRPTGRLHRELGLPEATVLMAHVGRGVVLKNRGRAIRILAEMPGDGAHGLPHLVFIGRSDTEGAREERDLARRLGVIERVHFLGQRSDVAELLADADVLLMTSTQEGLPGVLVEALAVGTPCVASELPGTRFVSELVPEVTLRSLASNDCVWVDALVSVIVRWRGDKSRRGRLRQAINESPFDARKAAEVMTSLWASR